MVLDVSQFPSAANFIPPTTLYSDSNKNDGWIYEQEKERQRDTKKRKRSPPKLFPWNGSSYSKDWTGSSDREHEYQCLRVNSSHSRGSQLPSNSLARPSIGRVHTIESSAPTLPHFADRKPKPKLPPLAIPRTTSSRSQPKMFPPTPRTMDTSTRDTIKTLGLSKKIPQAARPFPPNFVSLPSATSVLLCSVVHDNTASTAVGSKSTPASILGSIHKPLPPIPTSKLSSSPTSTSFSTSYSGDEINSNQINHRSPRGNSLPSRIGGHPTRETVSGLGFRRGRRLPPPPIILPTHNPTESVPSISPQPQNASHSQGRNTMHDNPPTYPNHAVVSNSSLVVTDSPSVPGDEGTNIFRPESQSNQRKSPKYGSDMSHSGTMLPSHLQYEDLLPRHTFSEPVRRVRGPRSPCLRGVDAWMSRSDQDGPQLSIPDDLKKSQTGLGFAKGVEKHSGSAKSKCQKLLGRDKIASRAQEEAQKQRPFLPPLNTSISSLSNMKLPDPCQAEEDQEQSAIDSRAVWLRDEGCTTYQSGSGSLRSLGYSSMFSPTLPNTTLWGDGPAVTMTKSSDLWEEIDFIFQLKYLRVSPAA